ncbi:hypothetical protein J1614_010603 [Plenodomus biglobosus]|nr:hypothetical protein J1614_010603 [Plenodomus biglobosus]
MSTYTETGHASPTLAAVPIAGNSSTHTPRTHGRIDADADAARKEAEIIRKVKEIEARKAGKAAKKAEKASRSPEQVAIDKALKKAERKVKVKKALAKIKYKAATLALGRF